MTPTELCNMSLGGLGAKRLNDLDTDSSLEAIQCRLFYEPTRDALLRSHYWRFASGRATLSEDTETPDFEYDRQFILPNDFLRLKSVFSDNGTTKKNTRYSFAIEGQRILTNESTCEIRYVKKVTDPTEFDPLFTEVLVLQLEIKLAGALTQDAKLKESLKLDLREIMPKVRALDRQETNTTGRLNTYPWVEARYYGNGTYRQDRV